MTPHAPHATPASIRLAGLRLARPSDAVDLQSYFRALSKVSRRNRFFGSVGEIPMDTIMRDIGRTNCNRFAIVALGGTTDAPRIVGEAVCAMTTQAEVALSVEDASQGTGIGRALLAAVEVQAAKRGARDLFGHIWSTNDPIRKLAATLGYTITRASGDWNSCILRKSLSVVTSAGESEPPAPAGISSRRTAVAAAGA